MKLFKHKSTAPKAASALPAGLQTEADKLKMIMQTIDDGVVLIDSQQTIQMLNPGAATIIGWSPEEATGLNVASVLMLVNVKGEPLDDADNPIKQVLMTAENVHNNDVILSNKSHEEVPVTMRVTPLLNDKKQVEAIVIVFTDVSQLKAEEKQRADFISTASHEMRTPVAAIEGYLALALNDKVSTIDNRARGYLEKAHSSTEHLGSLFQDLLTSAKAEDGRLTSHPAVLEISQFLDQLTGDLRMIAEKKGLFMDFVMGGSQGVIDASSQGSNRVIKPLYYVYADGDRLREVITNLFDNAVKYTPEGKITIGLTGNDQVVQCYIKDTGPGIPADDLPHLFQKFYRVDNSATRTIGGTGLGLFICRKIIELYNGRIWAESEVGKGSTFYINLPRLSNQRALEMQASVKPTTS